MKELVHTIIEYGMSISAATMQDTREQPGFTSSLKAFWVDPQRLQKARTVTGKTDSKALSRPPAGKIHSYLKEINLLFS